MGKANHSKVSSSQPRLTLPRRKLILEFLRITQIYDRPDLFGLPGQDQWLEQLYLFVDQKSPNRNIQMDDVRRWLKGPWGGHLLKQQQKQQCPASVSPSEKQNQNKSFVPTVASYRAMPSSSGSIGQQSKSRPKPKAKSRPKQKPMPVPVPKQKSLQAKTNFEPNRYRSQNSRNPIEQTVTVPNRTAATEITGNAFNENENSWSDCPTPSSLSSMSLTSLDSSLFLEDIDELIQNENANQLQNQNGAPQIHQQHQQQQQQQQQQQSLQIIPEQPEVDFDIRSIYQNVFEAIEIMHDACTKIPGAKPCLIPLEEISKIFHRNHHKLIFPRNYSQILPTPSSVVATTNNTSTAMTVCQRERERPPQIIKIEPAMQQQQVQHEIPFGNPNFENVNFETSNYQLLSSQTSTVRHTLSSRNAVGLTSGGVATVTDPEVNILGSLVRRTGLWTSSVGQIPAGLNSVTGTEVPLAGAQHNYPFIGN